MDYRGYSTSYTWVSLVSNNKHKKNKKYCEGKKTGFY